MIALKHLLASRKDKRSALGVFNPQQLPEIDHAVSTSIIRHLNAFNVSATLVEGRYRAKAQMKPDAIEFVDALGGKSLGLVLLLLGEYVHH